MDMCTVLIVILNLKKNGYRRNASTTKVNQFDLNGNFLNTYDSVSIAEKETEATNISMCINGKRHQSGGYVWRRKGDDFNKYPLEPNLRTREICQYDTDGQFIKEYKSIAEAERSLNIHNIQKGVKHICKTIGGYVWRYKGEPFK